MKAMMRLSKTQVPAIVKKNASGGETGNWDKTLHVMAGYTKFDCMLVGACGGRSGICNSNEDNIVWNYGGGGGGSLRFSGLLADLATLTPYSNGKAGSAGADHGDNVAGGSGTDGGDSFFGTSIAYGGKGATGGKINRLSGGDVDWTRGDGGNGGGNSAGLGTVGLGLKGDADAHVASDPGTWATSGGVSGSGGGGGGPARMRTTGVMTRYYAGDGGAGANGDADTHSAGGIYRSNMGGIGGGANVKPLLGVDEHYGGPWEDGDNIYGRGVVVLKMS